MATHGTCKFWRISCLSNNFSDKILLIHVAKIITEMVKKSQEVCKLKKYTYICKLKQCYK